MGGSLDASADRLRSVLRGFRLGDSAAGIVALVALFVAALTPYAAFFLTHHPDERHYTDAGIQMVQRGDYLTPYTADGQPRLKKPILPYWMTAISYRCFGVSPASSRMPFLLAGGGVVWLTYVLGLLVVKQRGWALLAALIVACNPSLIISAPRSTPDILLGFFLLLSTVGFVALLTQAETAWLSLAAAYGGGALAVLSKGLPAFVFVVYAVGFFLLAPAVRRRQRWTRHAVGWGVGSALAVSWFIAMSQLHGDLLATGFLADQVGDERLAGSVGKSLKHFGAILGLVGATLLPWIVPLLAIRFEARKFAGRIVRRPEYLFLLGWIGLWIGLASLVERVNLRYLLPLAPLLSVLAAQAWQEADAPRLVRWARPGWWLALMGLGAAALVSAAITAFVGNYWLAGALLATVAVLMPLLAVLGKDANAVQLAGLATSACLLMLAAAAVGLAHVALPEVGSRVAVELRKLPSPREHALNAVWLGEPSVAARARVFLGGEIPLHNPHEPNANLEQADVVLLAGRDTAVLGNDWSPTHVFVQGYCAIDVRDALRAARQGELAAFLESKRQYITVAVRRQAMEGPPARTASSGVSERSPLRN